MLKLLTVLILLTSCFNFKSSISKKKDQTKHNEEIVETNCYCNGVGNPGNPNTGGYGSNIPLEVEGIVADILPERSLAITDKDIIDSIDGTISFGTLLSRLQTISNLPDDDLGTQAIFRSYLDGFTHLDSLLPGELNDFRPRNVSRSTIENNWEKDENGNLKKTGAPYKLIAIMIRPELFEQNANGSLKSAGEIRFLYKFVKKGQSLEDTKNEVRRSYTILEYGMPVNLTGKFITPNNPDGKHFESWNRADWLTNIGQLSCFKQDTQVSQASYRIKIFNMLMRAGSVKYDPSIWMGGSGIKNVRVNDFLEGDWSLFGMKVSDISGNGFLKLKRSRLDKTPKDNYAQANGNAIVKTGLQNGNINEIKTFLSDQQNFNKISSLEGLNYDLPEKMKAWQNNYRPGASWIKELIPLGTIRQDKSAAEHVALKRNFSLNTCNSCHMNFTRDQHLFSNPIISQAALELGINEFKFQNLSLPVPFVHVDRTDAVILSEFIQEDIKFREQEAEFQMSALTCTEPVPTKSDIDVVVHGDKIQAPVGEKIKFTVTVKNKGPAILNRARVVGVKCPDMTKTFANIPVRRIQSTPGSSSQVASWTLSSLVPGDHAIFETHCLIEQGEIGDELVFQLKPENFELELEDNNLSDNESSFSTLIGSEVINSSTSTTLPMETADIEVDLSSDKDQVQMDEEFEIKIKIKNNGPAGDNLVGYFFDLNKCPVGSEYISHQVSGGFVSPLNSTGRLGWTISLDNQEDETLTILCQNKTSQAGAKLTLAIQEDQNLKHSIIDPDVSNNNQNLEIEVIEKPQVTVCDFNYSNTGGFSTLDLVFSQRVLLGIDQKIEGKNYDFNGDGKHSAIDLLMMRKCILGIIQGFKNDKCDVITPTLPCQ